MDADARGDRDEDPGTGAGPDGRGGLPADHRLGFHSLSEEVDDRVLEVAGSIPEWLSGTLLRNGPGKFEAGEKSFDHWFDGLAMIRRFAFEAGDVRYSNRFLRTEAYAEATGGEIAYPEFGTVPDRGLVERIVRSLAPETTDNAPVHVARLCGEIAALTETPRPVAFDPATLETDRILTFEDDVPDGHATAHHLSDPDRGETWGYVTEIGPRSAYHVWRLPDGSCSRELVGSVRVDEPAYVHSFGLTEDYAVITESPFVVNPMAMVLPSDEPFVESYEWKPWRETRFLVIDRETGELIAEPRAPPAFVFHHAKVVQREDHLLVDVVAFDDPRIVRGLYLDRLRTPDGTGGGGDLVRYRVPLAGEVSDQDDGGRAGDPPRAESETLYRGISLPRVGVGRHDGRPYRYAYGQDAVPGKGFAGGIVKVDVQTGAAIQWSEADTYTGEPVFVPHPDRPADPDPGDTPGHDPCHTIDDRSAGRGPDTGETDTGTLIQSCPGVEEDDGVVLVVALEADRGHSSLLVLDGEDLAEIGRARLPHHLPFGFHGRYFDDLGG